MSSRRVPTLGGVSKTERALDEADAALDDDRDTDAETGKDPATAAAAESRAESGPEPHVDPIDDHDVDPIDDHYELPEIVLATEPEPDVVADTDPLIARRAPRVEPDDGGGTEVAPEVSDDVLDELRRAEIDGPVVSPAPQDDTSSGIRRPRRSPEYDPAPMPIPLNVPRMLGRKPRVRRVTRVVRHVDPWSVFKIAIVANVVLYAILLTAGVLLWNVAYATGTIDNVERFFESFGWTSFEFNGGQIYHSAWVGGLFLVIGFTGLAVLAATLFNLITDLVGGMRFTVLEEEVVETRNSPMRRFVVRRPEPEVPAISNDASGPMIREAVVDDSGSSGR